MTRDADLPVHKLSRLGVSGDGESSQADGVHQNIPGFCGHLVG